MDQWLDLSDFFDQVQELIDLGLFDEARGLLDSYASTFADEWELHFLYSRLCTEQDKPREALPYLHAGLRLDPGNADCLLGLFYAHSMLRETDEAGKWLKEAEKLFPDNELILSAGIWHYAELNELQKAIARFERVREKGAANPETFRNAGIAYDRAGYYENAIECYLTALQLNPHYDEVRELLSDLYIASGRPEKAVELYQKALEESPKNIRHFSRLIFCLSQSNQPEKSLEVAAESIRRYPNSPIGYIDLAYSHLNQGNLEGAMAAADTALDIAPLDAESHRAKAVILSEQGSFPEAEKEFDLSLSLDRDNLETLRDYYQHFRHTGNFRKMEEILFKVIEKGDRSSVEDYWFLADYYKEKNEHAKALRCLHQAYKIRPGEFDILALIAEILIEKRHTRLAQKFLRRYVDRAGWNDVMAQIATRRELRGGWIREGLQFLHFYAGKPTDFRRHLFLKYIRLAIAVSAGAVISAAALPIYLLNGKTGLAWLAAVSVFIAAAAAAADYIRKKKREIPSYY